jgi:hypothetical protein
MNDAVTDFAKQSGLVWERLVGLYQSPHVNGIEGLAMQLYHLTGASRGAIKVKLRAIQYAREVGVSYEQIVIDGQAATLKRFAKARSKNTEKRKRICFLVSAGLADAFQCENPSPDAEEPLVTRLARCCGLRTSNDLIEFLLADYGSRSDLDLKHSAGEISADQIPRKRKRASS